MKFSQMLVAGMMFLLSFSSLAFDSSTVCGAAWDAGYCPAHGVCPLEKAGGRSMGDIQYAFHISTSDQFGGNSAVSPMQACATLRLSNGKNTDRVCSSKGLECSPADKTCHPGKNWGDCRYNGYTGPTDSDPGPKNATCSKTLTAVSACSNVGATAATCGNYRLNGRNKGDPSTVCKWNGSYCSNGGPTCTP
jgi:hypothetical protein